MPKCKRMIVGEIMKKITLYAIGIDNLSTEIYIFSTLSYLNAIHEENMEKLKSFEEKDAQISASSLNIIYKEMGLQQAIQYLYAFLQAYYPITRVFCGFRLINSPVFYPMADTISHTLEMTKISHGSYNTLDEKKLFSPKNCLEPYFSKKTDESLIYKEGIGRDEDYCSHIRIPLFLQDERVFQIGLCSNQENVFCDKDLKLVKILTKEISQSLLIQQQKAEQAPQGMDFDFKNSLDLLTMSRGLHTLLSDTKKIASTDYNVLIQGETGCGKDIVAQNIHEMSVRNDKPFIKVNCGAINESLLESELFGYEKGAFTGALTSRKGFFEAGQGGSIFLDEIGELPLKLQTALLRVIENKCIQKIGSNQEISVDVRIIAATNKDLEESIRQGAFREDLWYRLNVFPLKVPPLRLHREDIPGLVSYFIQKSCMHLGIINSPQLSKYEINKLYDHSWPGNIRELKNTVERAIINAREGNFCQPLSFEINYKEYEVTKGADVKKKFVSMEEYSTNYVKQVLAHTQGKITGRDGAASILKLHPNTVRQYKHKIEQ